MGPPNYRSSGAPEPDNTHCLQEYSSLRLLEFAKVKNLDTAFEEMMVQSINIWLAKSLPKVRSKKGDRMELSRTKIVQK